MNPRVEGRLGRFGPVARRDDQRGIALMEFLIAVMLLALTVGGIVGATLTAGQTGKDANQEARLNVLMTAFSEAVKALPYEVCAEATDYQEMFDQADGALPSEAEKLRNAADATLTVAEVPQGPDCPGVDSGVQTVTLEVTIRNENLTRQVVKRNPETAAVPLDFHIKTPVLRSGVNDPLVVWGVEAGGDSRIYQYEWWCDGDWVTENPQPEPPPADFVTYTHDDSTPECRYPAPAEGTVKQQRIALRVTEEGTGRTGITSAEFVLQTTLAPHNPPIAQISVTSNPKCTSANPCAFNTPISFASTGPPPVDAAILQWEWNFGDGSPTILCTPTPADPTGASCINPAPHTYLGGGEFAVKLTVVDSFGSRSATATLNITVTGPVVVKPVVNVNSSLTGTPAYGVSPQKVSFDASGSYADGHSPGVGSPPGGIANYFWEFGPDGATQSGANLRTPEYTYPPSAESKTYQAKVTVTDINGVTNFATMTIVLDPLLPPINLANNGDRKGDIPFIRNARFDFQWTNVPRTAGDTLQTVIRISSNGGFCGFLGFGVNYREFTVPSGAAGSVQTYRAQFSSSPFAGFNNVCSTDDYTFQGKTIRTTSTGTYHSNWSAPRPLDPTFF